MFKNKTQVEWVILAEGEEPASANRVEATPKSKVGSLRWLVAVLFMAVLVGSVYLWRVANDGIAQIETELEQAVAAEQWLLESDRAIGGQTYLNPQKAWGESSSRDLMGKWLAPGPAQSVEVVDLILAGDLAAVEAIMTMAENEDRYRQTRFYRHTPTGWIRVKPHAQLWGRPRTLRTEHLLFKYRARDHVAVKQAAPAVESAFAGLARTFDLPESDAQLEIEVSVLAKEGLGSIVPTLVIPSPATELASVQTSQADLLARSAILALIEHVRSEILVRDGPRQYDYPLMDALLLWHVHRSGILPSSWHQDTVRSVYSAEHPEELRIDGRNGYSELCAMNRFWPSTPLHIYASALCYQALWPPLQLPLTTLDAFRLFSPEWQRPVQKPPQATSLPYVIEDIYQKGYGRAYEMIALTTLVEYWSATFGHESLRELDAASENYSAWEPMLRDLLGVTTAEFEAGWQEYLAETYLDR